VFGTFQFRRKWVTSNGKVLNTVVNCPLEHRCKYRCQAKIVESPDTTYLFIADAHTAADHVSEKDSSKYLKYSQQAFIAQAVRIAPTQTATALIRNIQDSPTKSSDPIMKKSVQRQVREQRGVINEVLFRGVTVTNKLSSLAALADAMWFGDALKQHQEGQCIDLFQVFVIGQQIMERDRTVMLTFANAWDLLNMWRAVASGYSVQLFGDVTHKASQAAFNKLGFGVNMLGSRFAPWTYTLIPAQTESHAAYSEAYKASKAATRRIISLKACGRPDCVTCNSITDLRDLALVKNYLDSEPYKVAKALPIAHPLGDNSSAWQKFAAEDLGLSSSVCQTHLTAIGANNGQHKRHFKCMDVYEEFYDFVNRIMRCSFNTVGEHLQALLVEWLRSKEEMQAADWWERYWTGPVHGRWLLGHGGVGLSSNNQGLESTWRWDRDSGSAGREVLDGWCFCYTRSSLDGGVQVGLAQYLGGMVKTMKGASRELESKLRSMKHPNRFPMTPLATTQEWDMVQSFDHRTLLCTVVRVGNAETWRLALQAVYRDVESMRDLLSSLATVKRKVNAPSDATVLLMPSQSLMRRLLEEEPDHSDRSMRDAVRSLADDYISYYMRQDFNKRDGSGEYDLKSALVLYESFYVLEAQSPRWSKVHLFKCNCLECFKCASCCHSLLAGMMCDSNIRVPALSLGITVQSRRKRGRPSVKASEVGDAGEARARARIELQEQYELPRVCICESTLRGFA